MQVTTWKSMPRQFYLFFSLQKKLCIESTLKSVAGIFIVTASHSKKSWGHPDKSGESGTLDSSNGDGMHLSEAMTVCFYQFHIFLWSPLESRELAHRAWKRLDKLCACWSPLEWAGLARISHSDLPHYLIFQCLLGNVKGISMLNQISDKGQLITETVRNVSYLPLHYSLPTPNLT